MLSSKRLIFMTSYPSQYLFTRGLPHLVAALTGAASPRNCGQRLSNGQCLPSLSAQPVEKYHRPISHVTQRLCTFFLKCHGFSWMLVVVFLKPPSLHPPLPLFKGVAAMNARSARRRSLAVCSAFTAFPFGTQHFRGGKKTQKKKSLKVPVSGFRCDSGLVNI